MKEEIEKILWKAYNPDFSPNMEAVTEEILGEIRKVVEKIDVSGGGSGRRLKEQLLGDLTIKE